MYFNILPSLNSKPQSSTNSLNGDLCKIISDNFMAFLPKQTIETYNFINKFQEPEIGF